MGCEIKEEIIMAGMVVQHNMNALNAYNRLNVNVNGLKKSSEKLSSGYRINRAGDDAAGLAISEKMRSQIRGLNQAKRNSQDGISMIQTFEGALQESHSILQRMKELAAESANGTYDNATDRAAIQLEFDQLNDELNQIADTDFNGTVVLNGGEMADGLKAVDGEFNYNDKADQVAAENAALLADAQAKAQSKIDAAQAAFDTAKAVYDATENRDLSLNGNATQWNTIDDNLYTSEAANTLFDAVTDGADDLLTLGVTEFDVTFTFDGTAWEATKGSFVNNDGETVDLQVSDLTTNLVATATENGGFTIADAAGNIIGNAVLDTYAAADGDTVTLTFTNSANTSYAPTNIGMDEQSFKNTVGDSVGVPTLELSAAAKDVDNMNEEMKAALDKLNNAEVTINYASATMEASISDSDLTITADTATAGKYDISYTDADGKSIVLATITADAGHAKSAASATAADTAAQGIADTVSATFDGTKWINDADSSELDLADVDIGNTTTSVTVSGTAIKGDKLSLTTNANDKTVAVDYTQAEATVGKISFGIALDAYSYDAVNVGPTIDASSDPDSVDATAIDKAYADTKQALADAKAAYPNSIEDLGLEGGVSKSDSFDNSTAIMTYTDNITLQTGARTKDSVNFTFNYNTDGTADMGNLKANLNCSARADGLNTENLSLATQDDANYAIDQIDKAINKVSMVRASFGSIQNRLEHKIENITTTAENLTEAESTIRDTDMASEMMNYTKFNILQQAAQSMLAQANQQPQGILQLLG